MVSSIKESLSAHANDYPEVIAALKQTWGVDPFQDPYESLRKRINIEPSLAPGFSIIIPSYNSRKSLDACLKALDNASYCLNYRDRVEILVVDDGSAEHVSEWLPLHTFQNNIRILRQENHGRASAVNLGVACAGNDYIVVCDSDILLHQHSLEEIAKLFLASRSIVVLGFRGDIHPTPEDLADTTYIRTRISEPPKFWLDNRFAFDHPEAWPHNFYALSAGLQKLGHRKYIWTPAPERLLNNAWTLERCLYGFLYASHRDLYTACGGCNEDMKGWGWEDTELGACAISKGYKIVPAPSVYGSHIYHEDRSPHKWTQAYANYEIYRESILSSGQRKDFMSCAENRLIYSNTNTPQLVTPQPLPTLTPAVITTAQYHAYLGNDTGVIDELSNKSELDDKSLELLFEALLNRHLFTEILHFAKKHEAVQRTFFYVQYLVSLSMTERMQDARNYLAKKKPLLPAYSCFEYLARALLFLRQGSYLVALKDFCLYYLQDERSYYLNDIWDDIRLGLKAENSF